MSAIRVSAHLRCILLGAAIAAISFGADAQEKHYRFAYDQPNTTGYGVAGDTFANKMKELSKGQFLVDQYPGAQLGQEPQVLQLLKSKPEPDTSLTVKNGTPTPLSFGVK